MFQIERNRKNNNRQATFPIFVIETVPNLETAIFMHDYIHLSNIHFFYIANIDRNKCGYDISIIIYQVILRETKNDIRILYAYLS